MAAILIILFVVAVCICAALDPDNQRGSDDADDYWGL